MFLAKQPPVGDLEDLGPVLRPRHERPPTHHKFPGHEVEPGGGGGGRRACPQIGPVSVVEHIGQSGLLLLGHLFVLALVVGLLGLIPEADRANRVLLAREGATTPGVFFGEIPAQDEPSPGGNEPPQPTKATRGYSVCRI